LNRMGFISQEFFKVFSQNTFSYHSVPFFSFIPSEARNVSIYDQDTIYGKRGMRSIHFEKPMPHMYRILFNENAKKVTGAYQDSLFPKPLKHEIDDVIRVASSFLFYDFFTKVALTSGCYGPGLG